MFCVVWPVLQTKEYGTTPPDGDADAVPLHTPQSDEVLVVATTIGVGSPIVALTLPMHPFASIT
jgi:hypothetical protein